MLKGSEIIGLPVLIDHEINTTNYVKELIYSPKGFKVLGLSLNSKRSSRKQDRVIPFKKIQGITKAGVIISSENDIVFPYQIPEIEEVYKKPIKVLGFHIYNHKKDLVGVIKDTVIQKNTGRVIAFIISEGVIDDLFEGYSFLPILNYVDFHEDYIIMGEHEINSILPQGGGLKKFLGIE